MEKKAGSEKSTETKPKKPLWKRIVKGLLWFLGGTLVFVLVAVLTLPLWINPVATSLVKSLVPGYTGTPFNIVRVDLNPYTGKLLITGVELANPEGYSVKDAFALGSLSVDVEVSSLLSKTIHVRDITIDSPFASYVFDEGGVNNFDRIIEAVNKKLGPKKEKKDEEPGETKVVIDKVTITNVKVAVGNGRFELASLVLTDFGKDDAPARLVISGVQLVNPPGFVAENAFSLNSLAIGVETGDLAKFPIKVHDLVIDSPYASYVFDEKNVDNFTRLLEPLLAQGGKPEKEPKKEKKAEEKKAGPSGAPVTVDRLEVKNLKTHVCNGRFEFASLVVTDFGKPTVATVTLEGVKLVNPDGFKTPNAFSLGSLSVGLETGDLSKKPMVLHDIALKSLYAGYVFDESGASNIDVMFKPLMGGGKKADGKSENAVVEKKEDVGKTDEGGKGGLPVAIDKVTLEDLRADVGAGKAELTSITLTNFGKETPTKLEISGVKLANPPGFKAENAFSLGSLALGMDLRDLGKPPFKIQEIVIDSPYASYVFDEKNVDNFTRLLEPLLAQGGKPEKEPKKEKKAEEKKTGPSGSPVTVDRLEVKNLKTHVCNGRFEFASLVVTDFGKSTNTQVRLENVNLVNPEGFAGPNAFSLKSLSVGLETADLSKKPMVFHDIIVDSPYAGVFINGDWVLNFKALFKPLMGDKKDDEKEKKIAADEKKDEEKEKDEDASRVVIDKLDISGTKIQFDSPIPILKGTLGIPLPTFTDIGKESKDGATVKEVGEQILRKAEELAGPLGSTLDKIVRNPSLNMKELFDVDAMKALGNAKDFLASGTTNVLGSAKDFVSVGATNVLGNAKDFISGGTTNILGGAKGKLGDAVGNTKNFISGLIPGGDKKEGDKKADGKKAEGKKENEKKKEDDGSGTRDRATEGEKGR